MCVLVCMGWSLRVLGTAVLSASCGSMASVCGKLVFDTVALERLGLNFLPLRAVFIVCLVLLNSVMLSLFVGVLQSVSALQASLLAFVCNYLISTLVGVILFGESVSVLWAVGAVLMTAGAVRISTATPQKIKRKSKKA